MSGAWKMKKKGERWMMTPEEFAKEMERISDNEWRLEDRHISMNGLMCRLLESLGYEKGVDIFYNAEKWYS